MTLREHLEAIRDHCAEDIPWQHAVAALAILNDAAFGFDIDHGWREDRLIPDPGKNPELEEYA